jgi:hypothetical protein
VPPKLLHDGWAEGASPAAVVAGAAAAIGVVTIAAAAAPAIIIVKRLRDGAQIADSEQKRFAAIGDKS